MKKQTLDCKNPAAWAAMKRQTHREMMRAFAPKRFPKNAGGKPAKKLNGVRHFRATAIPVKDMRYCTVGDYRELPLKGIPGYWDITCTDLGNWRYNFQILIHELVEVAITQHQGIAEPDIVKCDKKWNAKFGDVEGDDEPGFWSKAPYRQAHTMATSIELAMAAMLDVSWSDYGKAIDKAWKDLRKAGKK